MKPDFSLLYSELNLPPDCSLEQFKCAYRQRVAALHPDKRLDNPPSAEAEAALAALTETYVAVRRFHRRHGRMPGASSRPGAGNGPCPVHAVSRFPVPARETDGSKRSARPTWRLMVVVVVVLLVLASWDWVLSGPR